MGLIKCLECGKEISDKSLYCLNCGCPVGKGESPKKTYSTCPNCGNPMERGSTVCSECGARLVSVNGVPVNGTPTCVGKISIVPVKRENKADNRKKNGENLAIAAMVCGIIGLCLSFVLIGILPAIAGLIMAIVAFCIETPKKKMAWAGVITSILGVLIAVVVYGNDTNSNSKGETEKVKTPTTEKQQEVEKKDDFMSDDEIFDLYSGDNPEKYIGRKIEVVLLVTIVPNSTENGETEVVCRSEYDIVSATTKVKYDDPSFECKPGDKVEVVGVIKEWESINESGRGWVVINADTIGIVPVEQEEVSDAFNTETEDNNLDSTTRDGFIASCQEFDYKAIARNPDEYVGKNFKINVEIFSTASGAWYSDYDTYYKAYTDDGSGIYFDHMIYLIDRQDTESDNYLKILDDDIVTIYGTFNGMTETENGITGESGEEVCIDIYYAELISE